MKKIVFNHYYLLRHDLKRTYIMAREDGKEHRGGFVNTQWISKIHPVFSMILSFFSKPIDMCESIEEIAYFLNISNEESRQIIEKLVNSKEPFFIEYDDVKSFFPKNIIINESDNVFNCNIYSPNEFAFSELELAQERPYTAPLGIVYMVNNICATDCVYCYADKSVRCHPLKLDKIASIIKDANRLKVSTFTIVGGEFFMCNDWENILDLLIESGYTPSLISTKVPLSRENILKYKKYNLPIQVSLDSIKAENIEKILCVKSDYLNKIKKTIEELDKQCIKFQISTVLTKYNDGIDDLEDMLIFLSKFKNLIRWEIRVGFKSLYSKKDFDFIKIKKSRIMDISLWISEKRNKTSNINILWSPDTDSKYFKTEGGSRNFVESRCSANYSHMVILPDGQVTICEQLYWNPKFIIGNLLTHTISEVWNSPQALRLAFPKKSDFREESACFSCEIFDDCINFPNRCIADIIKGYGDHNWDYPDPRCVKAPPFISKLICD
jgi:radical SAM protein with 4Fe4S-binding SPASM domain